MSNIQVTNSSATAKLFLDVDQGDRFNRIAKWVFEPSEVKSIDEDDIVVNVDQSLPDSLRSGQATITEADMDSLTNGPKRSFLASGLDISYEVATSPVVNKRVVQFDSTNNKVRYVTAQGGKPLGGTRQDGTTGAVIRVKTAGSVTLSSGGTVTSGSKLVSDTTGRVVSSTTIGDWQVGLAPSDATVGQELSVSLDIKQIA